MAFTLTTITPDGTKTVSGSITYGPQVVCAVSAILHTAAPWLTRRERDSAGMHIARSRKGVPLVHLATGLVFQVETVPGPVTPLPGYAGPLTDETARTTLTLHT